LDAVAWAMRGSEDVPAVASPFSKSVVCARVTEPTASSWATRLEEVSIGDVRCGRRMTQKRDIVMMGGGRYPGQPIDTSTSSVMVTRSRGSGYTPNLGMSYLRG
jgi:hypothetical protein